MSITQLPTFSSPAGVAAAPPLAVVQAAQSVTIGGAVLPAASDSAAGCLDAARATIIDGLAKVASSGSFGDLINTLSWFQNFIIDGAGSAIATGQKGFLMIGAPISISGWALFADQSGSIAIDIWKLPFASGFPPVSGNSIVAGAGPSLSSQQSNSAGSLSGLSSPALPWATNKLNVGDVLAINVNSATTVTRVTLFLLGSHT